MSLSIYSFFVKTLSGKFIIVKGYERIRKGYQNPTNKVVRVYVSSQGYLSPLNRYDSPFRRSFP